MIIDNEKQVMLVAYEGAFTIKTDWEYWLIYIHSLKMMKKLVFTRAKISAETKFQCTVLH